MTLLDAKGNPVRSSDFKKGTPPKTGEAFAVWGDNNSPLARLPMGGIVQFNLENLTVHDYRAMRTHYQVNASLSVLSFMQHQSDWHIVCDGPNGKKIAAECEEQLREMWTPLNRAMAHANWAGYSPNILQWENDNVRGRVVLDKIKDLVPEVCEVNWKEVDAWVPQGKATISGAKVRIYDGLKQVGAPWPTPVDNCVHPDTKILCADSVWRRAGDLEVGQEIVSFDEDEQNYGRRYRTAVIEVNNPMEKECVTVTTDLGQPITMSVDHPVLVRRGAMLTGNRSTSKYKDHWVWVNAADLQPGDRIGYFGDPWETQKTWEAGYIAGIVDGEGSLSSNGTSWNLSFSQRCGWVLERALAILDEHDFKYTVNSNERDDCQHVVVRGGLREYMRFFGMFAPERVGRQKKVYENAVARIGRSVDTAVVQTVENVGTSPIASIQTSTGTFITQGYLTHNTFWYPLLMENGDYKGRHLLKAAFTSWYFSILIHLFANRYYERFGEPIVVGRAPFEDDVKLPGSEQRVNGIEYMLKVISDLRSRSVVALPNDATAIGDTNRVEWDYDLEYLESQMRGADWERYLTRLDEEISIGLFTPILLLRTADVGSYNLGVGHLQMYLWMMNAMNDDRKLYIDKYILSRMVDFNFSPKAPRAKIKFRKLGNQNAEVIRTIIDAMMTKGTLGVDVQELGEIAGLSLKEIRATQQTEEPVEDPDDEDDGGDPDAKDTTKSEDGLSSSEPRATAKKMTARVQAQVEREQRMMGSFSNVELDPGFRRKLEHSLFKARVADPMSAANQIIGNTLEWAEESKGLFAKSSDFVSGFERVLDAEISEFVPA